MENIFKGILQGKVVIVGIGNILRGDDGFGPALIEKLKDKIKHSCIDVGTAPENYIGKIVKENPETILIIDAIHLGRNSGEYEILKKDDIKKAGLSTHDISPSLFIEHLENQAEADIYLLGVQPKSISLGDEMSDSLKKTLEEISQLIEEAV